MPRRLSRRTKDLICMHQLASCGYCGRELCDAFEVDHINENCMDDREINLVAACALCHAIKSRHVRLGRDWSAMREAIEARRQTDQGRWRSGATYDDLPVWLQARVTRRQVDFCILQSRDRPSGALDLEQYRHRPAPRRGRRSG